MQKITRRQFLLALAAGASATVLSACEQKRFAVSAPTATRVSEAYVPTLTSNLLADTKVVPAVTSVSQPIEPKGDFPTSLPIPTAVLPTITVPTVSYPDIVVARGGNDPETLVRRAITALGGMEQYVTKGAKVVIKPNICTAYHSYEYASTTNPWVVAALVKLCYEVGAGDVSVMDFPFGGSPEEAYAISGIREQVESAGGKMVVMSRLKYVETEIPKGLKIKKWPIYDDVLNADVLINVPITKDHGLAKLTLGMKNLMGVVLNREGLHSSIGQRLADLTSRVYPTLTIVDSIRILLSGGPTGGNLDAVKKLDTIIASRDIIAADSFAATLFGMEPGELSYITAGVEMGLGRSDIQNLRIEEIAVGG